MTKDIINLHWIRWHGKKADRVVEITVHNWDDSIDLGLYKGQNCVDFAEHLREIADELDPQEDDE